MHEEIMAKVKKKGCTLLLPDVTEFFPMNEVKTFPVSLFQTFCNEAFVRIQTNLNQLKDPKQLSDYKAMAEISKSVCAQGTPVQGNPLGV